MNKIVTNSTPIISLSILGKLDLLNELFEEVYVPNAVYEEIVNSNSTQSYGRNELEHQIKNGNFVKVEIKNQTLINTLYGKLHEGELEVIVGAKELDLNYVLIDERTARNMAKTFLLRPIGTVGILILAKKKGKIDKVKPHLDKLIANGIFLSVKLYNQVLAEVNESK